MREQPEGDPAPPLPREQLRSGRLLLIARRARAALLALAAFVAVEAGGATARAQEPAPADLDAEALVDDLDVVVEAHAALGWTIDHYEYEAMMPSALLSVCQALPHARTEALATLDARIAALGGPVEVAFRRNGRSLRGLGDLLFATRVRALLAEAMRRAPAQCPFWLLPDPAFRGVQTDARRFTINLEGGGLFVLQQSDGRSTLGGGGTGRLLLGYGFDARHQLLVGAEFGGNALFQQTKTGTDFPIQFTGAVPVVLRFHDVTWRHDLEAALLGFATERQGDVRFGVRVGGLLGLSALRIRGVQPWAGIAVAYEAFPSTSTERAFSMLKGGARIGFDWDF